MMQLCFPVNGHQICWPIPILVNPFHFGPDPDPWVVGGVIDKETALQLQAMSTISAAADKLPATHQTAVKAALSEMTVALEKRVPGASIRPFKPTNGPGPDPAVRR